MQEGGLAVVMVTDKRLYTSYHDNRWPQQAGIILLFTMQLINPDLISYCEFNLTVDVCQFYDYYF